MCLFLVVFLKGKNVGFRVEVKLCFLFGGYMTVLDVIILNL